MKIATYNILRGEYRDLILKNLDVLVGKDTDILCLQEVVVDFKNQLEYFFKEKGFNAIFYQKENSVACGLVIAWRSDKLVLEKSQEYSLPTLDKPALVQKFRTINIKNRMIERGALSAYFLYNGKRLRVIDVHLAWEGGFKHTMNQLSYLQKELFAHPEHYEILLGDFNTFTPFTSLKRKESILEKVFGNGMKDVFFDLPWSCDISYLSKHDELAPTLKFLRNIGMNLRFRFDYVFTKNFKATSKEILNLPGSDHRPLICNLDFLD